MQIQKLAEKVLHAWNSQGVAVYKVDEKKVLERAILAVKTEYDREAELEKDVHKMLDQLEKSHGGEFERYKMYPLLKQKLAKERKLIL